MAMALEAATAGPASEVAALTATSRNLNLIGFGIQLGGIRIRFLWGLDPNMYVILEGFDPGLKLCKLSRSGSVYLLGRVESD